MKKKDYYILEHFDMINERGFQRKNKSSAIHQFFFQKFGAFDTEKNILTNHVYAANLKLFFCFLFFFFWGGGVLVVFSYFIMLQF